MCCLAYLSYVFACVYLYLYLARVRLCRACDVPCVCARAWNLASFRAHLFSVVVVVVRAEPAQAAAQVVHPVQGVPDVQLHRARDRAAREHAEAARGRDEVQDLRAGAGACWRARGMIDVAGCKHVF